ncbi:transcriptional regulator, DeoR family [Coriobacterium glomerans PW2]|uniref:Transcriptional regulator, DeoR family n=1 Tax=Coriobacterium glomerans (strain ATCC 49209 / DSM 20642 / JCM 10262 / PW2) TaxID=700015 RepID=F2N728_CORGP|nr:DeoR/GlpR family DNA-binding transcription regulator [Coriobacterium glomerans]AEB06367.1 transcriptional regulator, DeoR family [Coriobacterium glomerans PW2]
MAMTSVDERREKIVHLVNTAGSVSFGQIKTAFPEVSDMTLRTDLKALDECRRIVRIHGGARSVEFVIGTDDMLDSRSLRNVAAKETIAEKAAALVRSDSTIFLDSGSTTTMVARDLDDQRMLVFTASLTCAMELARLSLARSIIVGGALNRFSFSLNGGRTLEDVRGLNFDQFFLGITSYQDDFGFSCGSDEETAVKRACIERAEQTVALMDSSKIGRRSTFQICDLDDVDIIVSDGCLPESFLHDCARAGVRVV